MVSGGPAGGGFEAGPPKRKWLEVFVPLLPRFFAQILAAKSRRRREIAGVEIFPFQKRPAGHGAFLRAVLDTTIHQPMDSCRAQTTPEGGRC
jgi:hypothetical protein